MNRRGFIGGVAAAFAAATTSARALFTENVNFAPHTVVRKGKKFLYVCASARDADRIHQLLGRPHNLKCNGVGSPTTGYAVDMIIMDDKWADEYDNHIMRKRVNDWYQQSVRTRLMPGGTMVQATTKTEQFNWGQSCAVSTEFRAPNKVLRKQGVHLRMPQANLTRDDRLRAKAQLLDWYMRQQVTE